MYIRTHDEALASLAEILDLPERRDQIIQSTVRIMLCLDSEPRLFLADCQALLIQGGLEALRRARTDALEAMGNEPIVVLDPEEDRLFEEIASALDALRFAEVVRQVFPALRCDRWQVARALLLYESGFREQVAAAVRGRGKPEEVDQARGAVESMIFALRPPWIDRVGALRNACLAAIKSQDGSDPSLLHQEAERLFEIIAVADQRAGEVLAAFDADPAEATRRISLIGDLSHVAENLQRDLPPGQAGDGAREVA